MGLPFQPETNEQLKARFKKALEEVWDADAISLDPQKADRPALHREHVFDFKDGIRLIISMDKTCDKLYFHASGSGQTVTLKGKDLIEQIIKKIQELNGKPFEGTGSAEATTGGIIHFLLPIDLNGETSVPFQPGLN